MSSHAPDTELAPYPHWMPTINRICEKHGVAWKEVTAGYHDPRVVACRHEIWRELYAGFRSSFKTIGARTGGFHPSTVLAAVHKRRAAA